MAGLHLCSCTQGLFFAVALGPLIAAASLVAHTLWSVQASVAVVHSMWDRPRPGFEPVPPALAGRFLPTGPPEKSKLIILKQLSLVFLSSFIWCCMI